MQKWQDIGIITSSKRFGEDALILDIFTAQNGMARGMVKNASSPKKAPLYQIGNLTEVVWTARLEEHLGSFSVELIKSYGSLVLHNPLRLEGLLAACGEVSLCLPEKEAYPELFVMFKELLEESKDNNAWEAYFVVWEKELLAALGFAMDLQKCALTGETENLAYVSPNTGRAVTADAAVPWIDKLLKLPSFLTEGVQGEIAKSDILDGLNLTGFFLKNLVFANHFVSARERFISRLEQKDFKSLNSQS